MTLKLENNARQIDLALKKYSIDEIDTIIERLQDYKEKVLEKVENEEELKNLIEATKALESTSNVRIAIKRTAYNRPPKYQYKEDGEIKTWAGVGKMPKELKKQITVDGEMNKDLLENFLIVKDKNAVYQFRDESGHIRTWSGKGKCPKGLQLLLDKGYNLEQFKIKAH